MLIVLTPLALTACAGFGQRAPLREPVTRDIPPPPSYLKPAPVPTATVGASPFVVAEQRKQVIVKQNRIIVGAKKAWSGMKDIYGRSYVKKKFF
jgi:hypothetical protein